MPVTRNQQQVAENQQQVAENMAENIPPVAYHLASPFLPDKFKGLSSENETLWISRFDNYTKLCNHTEQMKCYVFRSLMTEQAESWFEELPEETKQDYDLIKQAFIDHFSNTQLSWVKERDFITRLQKPDESVESYLADLRQKGSRLRKTPKEMLTVFLNGLLPELQKNVVLHQPSTLAEAAQQAKLCESVQNIGQAQAGPDVQKQLDKQNEMIAILTAKITDLTSGINGIQSQSHQPQASFQARPRYPNQPSKPNGPECGRCGYKHNPKQVCPATGQRCNRCQSMNHFARKCRTNFNFNRSQQHE